jgi:prephenate dehydrogenase
MIQSIGIVGLGLIGGSLAEAVKVALPNTQIRGADSQPETLEQATQSSIFTSLSASPDAPWNDLDLVVVCVPLGALEGVFAHLKTCVASSTILTDVIGVKTPVQLAAQKILGEENLFIGCHPMAGGIVPGFSNRKPDLFKGFPVAICGSSESKIAQQLFEFWEALGAEPLYMTADEHDRVVAFTSHLPYLSSVVLRDFAENDETTKGLRGPGFQRATRYAAFLPEIMGPVVAGNPHVPELLREFAKRFEKLASTLEDSPQSLTEELKSGNNG